MGKLSPTIKLGRCPVCDSLKVDDLDFNFKTSTPQNKVQSIFIPTVKKQKRNNSLF